MQYLNRMFHNLQEVNIWYKLGAKKEMTFVRTFPIKYIPVVFIYLIESFITLSKMHHTHEEVLAFPSVAVSYNRHIPLLGIYHIAL